jgi:predicted aldo/keto reductase-like oxidoreductase
MKRREFLKSSALLSGAALLGTIPKGSAAKDKEIIQRYTELGKTGIKMSDISFGCGKLSSPALVARALDRGINYYDTAPDYGNSEKVLGNAIKKINKRDKMYIASKFCSQGEYPGHLPTGTQKKVYIEAIEASLKNLQTDYLDVCFVHAIGEGSGEADYVSLEKKRLFDENMLSAAETLKKDGKIRSLAVSSHGPNSMDKLLLEAIQSGYFDVIQPAISFMYNQHLTGVLDEAKRKRVGVIAMKTLAGGKHIDIKPGDAPFEQAAFKWVLQNKAINGLIVTINNNEQLNNYVTASNAHFTPEDQKTLDIYMTKYASDHCRTGCGDCQSSCSKNVSIAAIMRFNMYYQDYGMEKRAMDGYKSVDNKADSCNECAHKSCEKACPFGLPVASILKEAHSLLT